MCTCIWLAPVAPHALHYSAAPASACEQYSHYKKKKKIGPKSGPVKTGPTGPVATALLNDLLTAIQGTTNVDVA